MKIASLQLQLFKRFTDLTIEGLGPDVQLVILAGPNGSGKSSPFDAIMAWRNSRYQGFNDDLKYYRKGAPIAKGTSERVGGVSLVNVTGRR